MSSKPKIVYYIETKTDVYWSERKLDVIYKHVDDFDRRDKARLKELPKGRFNRMKDQSPKKFWRIEE